MVCPSGGPVGSVDLRVASSRGKDQPLPLRTINRLEEGDTILYKPLLRSGEQRKGEVAIVLVPADIAAAGRKLVLLDPKDASKPQEWEVPVKTGVVAYVYGPSGLDAKKVKTYLSKDDELIGQLADYADKTAQTEALISTLLSPASSADAVQSSLAGFASSYGLNVQLDRTAPNSQQALSLFRTLNPALATYDPVSPQAPASGQTAGLATGIAAMFYGTPVGLAAGGTAMLMELRSLAFPRSEFRSSFSQPLPDDGMGLCGRRDPPLPHTKVAYIWASRVPNTGPPQLSVTKVNSAATGMKTALPVEATDPDWKFAGRARDWALQSNFGKPVPVKVMPLAATKQLELDLEASLKPGTYSLIANWDWDHFRVGGEIHVETLSEFTRARIAANSKELLVSHAGKVPVTLEGADFEFVTKVEIQKLNDEFATPAGVPFVLPRGLRQGPQDRVDIQIDTAGLEAGPYQLLITQIDNQAHPVNFTILPAPPGIENFPVTLNQGVSTTEYQLKGQHLDSVTRLEVARGTADLGPAAGPNERKVTLHMAPDIAAGTGLAMKAYVAGRSQPLTFADAVRITGAKPEILEARVAQPPGQDVQLNEGELAGGSYLSAMLRVGHLQSNSMVRLACGASSVTLHLGERNGALSLQQISPDQVFLSFDTTAFPNRCDLEARVANGNEGESAGYKLGAVVRVPGIEGFDGAKLTGRDLEMIEKTGWAPDQFQPVAGLPLPIPGKAPEQTLEIAAPPADANGGAQLYVWLRGEEKPRATKIRP